MRDTSHFLEIKPLVESMIFKKSSESSVSLYLWIHQNIKMFKQAVISVFPEIVACFFLNCPFLTHWGHLEYDSAGIRQKIFYKIVVPESPSFDIYILEGPIWALYNRIFLKCTFLFWYILPARAKFLRLWCPQIDPLWHIHYGRTIIDHYTLYI